MTWLSGNRSIICFQFSTSFPKAIQFSAVLMSERSFVYNFNNKFALVHITANKEFSQSWDRNSNIILSKEIKNQHTKTWEMPKLKYHLMAAINQLTTPCLIGSWEDQNKFIINPHPHQTTKKKNSQNFWNDPSRHRRRARRRLKIIGFVASCTRAGWASLASVRLW